jgi:hypothetical protein
MTERGVRGRALRNIFMGDSKVLDEKETNMDKLDMKMPFADSKTSSASDEDATKESSGADSDEESIKLTKNPIASPRGKGGRKTKMGLKKRIKRKNKKTNKKRYKRI